MNLIIVENTSCVEMITLKVKDNSFISDIKEDLNNFFKFEVDTKDNYLQITLHKYLEDDLQLSIIKSFVKYYNNSVYECICGDFEYKANEFYCSCGSILCNTCKNLDSSLDSYICDDCLEVINNEELEDY